MTRRETAEGTQADTRPRQKHKKRSSHRGSTNYFQAESTKQNTKQEQKPQRFSRRPHGEHSNRQQRMLVVQREVRGHRETM